MEKLFEKMNKLKSEINDSIEVDEDKATEKIIEMYQVQLEILEGLISEYQKIQSNE